MRTDDLVMTSAKKQINWITIQAVKIFFTRILYFMYFVFCVPDRKKIMEHTGIHKLCIYTYIKKGLKFVYTVRS